ncbi:MAG: acyltransferase [Lachnospiraceae bacterium]|nr:acyltransferase [Lachnospiraceae bacterium]
MKEKFNSIDLFKFLMAIVVVAFHTNPFVHCKSTLVNEIVIMIADMSVPFFFMASGYLLAVRWGDTRQQREQYIQKTLLSTMRLYVTWTLLSLPLTIYGYIMSGNGIISCIVSYIKYFLFVGKLYNSYHLWYLLAMIYAFLAMWILIHWGKGVGSILATGVFFYAVYLLFGWNMQNDNVNDLLAAAGKVFYFVFNSGNVLTGMLYMSIGICIRERGRVSLEISIVGIAAGILVRYSLSQELGNILLSVMLFALILNIKLKDNAGYIILRSLSKYIYLLHLLCFSFYTFIIIRQPNKLGIDSFIVTFTLATVISAAVIYGKGFLKRKVKEEHRDNC